MNRIRGGMVMLLLALGAWPGAAHAAASCTILSLGGTLVDFGTYNALEGDRDSTGQIQFLCVPDLLSGPTVAYMVSAGAGGAGSFNPRKLMSGANSLNYNLYRDVSRTQVFGDGSAGTAKIAGTCLATCGVTVYGRVFGSQVLPGGQYRDDILVTLEF